MASIVSMLKQCRVETCAAFVMLLGACAAAAAPRVERVDTATTRPATLAEFLRVRCSLDGRDVLTSWTGAIYAFVPGERQRHLFDVVGMNVARCVQAQDGRWQFTSRELLYYLDPASGAPVHRWQNPWTGEEVPVVHVANSPVQGTFERAPEIHLAGGLATFALDIPLFYPNRLAADARLRAYSPAESYQAGEFFVFTAPAVAVQDEALTTVPAMSFTWQRVGPWLPWMKMGDRPGLMVYSARGQKVSGTSELPALLREELATRLPRFASAPGCYLAAMNETSWTYFARHLDAYLAGQRFPVPAPIGDEPCAAE